MAARKKSAPSPFLQQALDNFASILNDATFVVVDGTFKATQKLPGGTFVRRVVDSGTELVFSKVYIGKSGKPNFCFKPFDAQQFDQIEATPKECDTLFGSSFKDELCKAFGIEAVNTDAIIKWLITHLEEAAAAEKEERAAAALTSAQETYKNHPLFGRF